MRRRPFILHEGIKSDTVIGIDLKMVILLWASGYDNNKCDTWKNEE